MIEWRPVKGFENLLEVSSAGDIRSTPVDRTDKNGRVYSVKGKELAKYTTARGYVQSATKIKGEQTILSVHRTVAEAFILNPNRYSQVNHKDGDKLNNIVSNLEWCSRDQNMKHALETGKYKKFQTKAINLKTGEIFIFDSSYDASKKLGVHTGNISRVANGLQKQTGGYTFSYI